MPDRPARVVPGAPPPGTLHKRPRPTSDWQRRVEWARQPTGGWKVDDFCMTPSGSLCRVVTIGEFGLDLQYVREGGGSRPAAVDVTLKTYLCRWLSAREVRALKQPEQGHWKQGNEGGADAAA
jgi:hypothetical protein